MPNGGSAGEGSTAGRTTSPSTARSTTADDAVITELLAGNEAAFTALVRRYHGSLVGVALAFVGDRATAEEVAQETWVAVLNGLRRFERRSSLKTWIFAILTNRARTRAVREKRSMPFSALSDGEALDAAVESSRFTADGMWAVPPRSWGADNPEDQLLRRDTMAVLQAAIAELPAQQRAVVTMRDVEGLTAHEVCEALHVSDANQRVLLHRARSRLRAVLERHFDRTVP